MAVAYTLGIQNCVYGHVDWAADFFGHTERLEEKRFTGHYLSRHSESGSKISHLSDLALERGYAGNGKKYPSRFLIR